MQLTGSATPPDVHLTSFYVGVLPGLPPVIEGLGMRLVLMHSCVGHIGKLTTNITASNYTC